MAGTCCAMERTISRKSELLCIELCMCPWGERGLGMVVFRIGVDEGKGLHDAE